MSRDSGSFFLSQSDMCEPDEHNPVIHPLSLKL